MAHELMHYWLADKFGSFVLLRCLLEAEIIEPLMLQAHDDSPGEREIELAAERAVAAFLRAYAPVGN